MKKQISVLSLLGFSILTLSAAHAADGTVNFTGSIISESCTVDSGTDNQTVILGNIADSAFSAAGDSAASSNFSINLTGCPVGVSEVVVKFDGLSDSNNNELLALDAGSTATGVAVEIANAQGVRIPLFTNSPLYTVDSGNANLQFVGRYVATEAAVGAGTANATTQFTIIYQ